jgi:hypothetical protein
LKSWCNSLALLYKYITIHGPIKVKYEKNIFFVSEKLKVFHICIILTNEGSVNMHLFSKNVFSKRVLCNFLSGECSRYSHLAMSRTAEEFCFDSQEGKEIIFSLLFLNVQAGSNAHPAPYSVATEGLIPGQSDQGI